MSATKHPPNLAKKARLLWRLILDTKGMEQLEEPLRRVERNFDRLTRDQKTTIGIVVSEFLRGCHAIDTQAANPEVKTETQAGETVETNGAQAIEADYIPPSTKEAEATETE